MDLTLLKNLQATTKDYVGKERIRLNKEADIMKAILSGRTGGKGIQAISKVIVASAAQRRLQEYLSGA